MNKRNRVRAGNDLARQCWTLLRFAFGQWRVRFKADLTGTACSRPLLENTIRRRLAAHPKITILEKQEVVGLLTDEGKTRATGVKMVSHDAARTITTLTADLVVDASGRDSHASEWLTELGYVPPSTTVVNAFPGYATRIYKRVPGFDWLALYEQPTAPDLGRGAIILPMEGDRWHVTLIGFNKDYPPTTEEGFLEFARSLPAPDIYQAIKNAEPLSPIRGYQRAENRLNHYEKLPRYLDNFVVVGDAVQAFNPVYGQGMSIAAVSAETLGQALRKFQSTHTDLIGFAQVFHAHLSKTIAVAWQLATGEDSRWSKVETNAPAPNAIQKLMGSYILRLLMTANTNAYVLERFLRVQNMLASPAVFFQPGVLMRVLRGPQPVAPAETPAPFIVPARQE